MLKIKRVDNDIRMQIKPNTGGFCVYCLTKQNEGHSIRNNISKRTLLLLCLIGAYAEPKKGSDPLYHTILEILYNRKFCKTLYE